jgi:competence protein ComGC
METLREYVSEEKGSGLIGMLVVIVIIGVVFWYMNSGGGQTGSSYSPPSGGKIQESLQKARQSASKQELAILRQAISIYRAERGANPPTLRTLAEEGYVSESALRDSEGKKYEYDSTSGEVN